MIILLVLLGIGAVVGIVATVVDLRRDGYRRMPNRPEHDFGPIREERSGTTPL
ncbi:hypothetical protein [Herbiconiux ginsengi]|uniref:Uncharacterized protein n=1 Tax=Herbiconiux ginsengi TaxID=381665 RepID=A0A1H3RQV4_9MICO|nr:hypothetical protein [Herbiconiux ginsengi]SDZ28013.1 hypothetical protein SAMN05216554_3006 [Herbiconiux ginsengi]